MSSITKMTKAGNLVAVKNVNGVLVVETIKTANEILITEIVKDVLSRAKQQATKKVKEKNINDVVKQFVDDIVDAIDIQCAEIDGENIEKMISLNYSWLILDSVDDIEEQFNWLEEIDDLELFNKVHNALVNYYNACNNCDWLEDITIIDHGHCPEYYNKTISLLTQNGNEVFINAFDELGNDYDINHRCKSKAAIFDENDKYWNEKIASCYA